MTTDECRVEPFQRVDERFLVEMVSHETENSFHWIDLYLCADYDHFYQTHTIANVTTDQLFETSIWCWRIVWQTDTHTFVQTSRILKYSWRYDDQNGTEKNLLSSTEARVKKALVIHNSFIICILSVMSYSKYILNILLEVRVIFKICRNCMLNHWMLHKYIE